MKMAIMKIMVIHDKKVYQEDADRMIILSL